MIAMQMPTQRKVSARTLLLLHPYLVRGSCSSSGSLEDSILPSRVCFRYELLYAQQSTEDGQGFVWESAISSHPIIWRRSFSRHANKHVLDIADLATW